MSRRFRRIVRSAVLVIAAAVPLAMAPCESSLQYPTPPTQTYWGVALDLP